MKTKPTRQKLPGILAAVADEVDPHFPLASLDGEVGFAARGTQCNRRARADGPSGHLIKGNAAQAKALVNLLNTHLETSEAVALLAHLDIDRHLAVGHVRAMNPQVPVHPAGA